MDRESARLFAGPERLGPCERPLVLLTSDHGGFEHGQSVYQELLHVPLIVWGPGVERGRESAPVSLVDLAPTLLDATAVDLPQDEIAGISLRPRLSGEVRRLPSRPLVAEGTFSGAWSDRPSSAGR